MCERTHPVFSQRTCRLELISIDEDAGLQSIVRGAISSTAFFAASDVMKEMESCNGHSSTVTVKSNSSRLNVNSADL